MSKEIILNLIKESAYATSRKSTKFLSKQAKDIQIFGAKVVERAGISEKLLEILTPFRRLSKRSAKLSDSKYFISKFEADIGKDFLPIDWNKFTEAEKVDFIVKDRYSKLVAHKIMGRIKNEKMEHFFSLDKEGNIVFYKKGNQTHCGGIVPLEGVTVHNHPGLQGKYLDVEEIECVKQHKPELLGSIAHGGEDIKAAFTSGERYSFVVDAMDNRFLLEVPTDIRTAKPLDKLSASIEPMNYINKGDNATLFAYDKIRPEKDSKVWQILEEGKVYQSLKGTPEYDANHMKQIVLNLNCAKADALPTFTWREDLLKILSEQFGFRFKKV